MSAATLNEDYGVDAAPLRWIENQKWYYLLPLGSKLGHIHLIQDGDETWKLFHIAPAGTMSIGSVLAAGLSYRRARQFAEKYARTMRIEKSLTAIFDDPILDWRKQPMSDTQRARLISLGAVEPLPQMTAGTASDLSQQLLAKRLQEIAL